MAEPTEAEFAEVVTAYVRQRQQLSGTRSTLAEAVQVLRDELAVNRADLTAMGEHSRAQGAEITKLETEITKLTEYAAKVEQEARETHAAYASLHRDFVALQDTKLMRWSAPYRTALQRMRTGGGPPDAGS